LLNERALENRCHKKAARRLRMSSTRYLPFASHLTRCANSSRREPRSSCWMLERNARMRGLTCRRGGPSVSFQTESRCGLAPLVCRAMPGSLPTVLYQMRRQLPVSREIFSGRVGLTDAPYWAVGRHGQAPSCPPYREEHLTV